MDLEHHDWPDEPRYAPGRRRAHGDGPVRLVVLGDSFTFTDDRGPQLPDEPTSWPNVTARAITAALGQPVEVQVLARPARTVPQALDLVRKDRHVQFEVLAHADAVVLALGSYDHAPLGVPTPVEALVPFVRPPSLRRRVRLGLHAAYPHLVRATGGRFARTPWSTFARDHDALLDHLRAVAHGAAAAAVGPSSHNAAYYGWTHPRFEERAERQLAAAAAQGFTPVPAWPHVEAHLDELNEDGIHWARPTHAAVGAEVAAALIAQLRGDADRPPRPGRDD